MDENSQKGEQTKIIHEIKQRSFSAFLYSFDKLSTREKVKEGKVVRQKQDFRVNNLNSSNFIETKLDLAIMKRNKVQVFFHFVKQGIEKSEQTILHIYHPIWRDNGSSLNSIILLHHHQVFAFWWKSRRD